MSKIIALLSIYFMIEPCVSTVIIADNTMSKMIELTTKPPYCYVHTDRGTIQSMLLSFDPRKIRQMTDESIAKLEHVCKNNEVQSAHQGGFIYPGTKWCGPGNVARNFSDLGHRRKEDMCCRQHDNCPNSLEEGQCRNGICNTSPFTRSHCDCDAAFRRCLQNVNTETANTIGAIFFNVVQVICFKERSPCSQWQNDKPVESSMLSYLANLANYYGSENSDCPIEFVKSGRYSARVGRVDWRSTKEFIVNTFFRKLRLL